MIQHENLPEPFNKPKIEDQLQAVCQKNGIVFMAMFGSFARGEQKRTSDVDLAIKFQKNSKKTLFDLVNLEYEMKKVFKRKIDIGLFRSINKHVVGQVKKEMKVIYEER
ncbi:MAG: nucleotidyltransferase domain-containing protein [bacterium]